MEFFSPPARAESDDRLPMPIFEAKPELVARKWMIRIEQAPTVAMLKEVGLLLKAVPLSDEDRQLARDLYAARLKWLRAHPLPGYGDEEK